MASKGLKSETRLIRRGVAWNAAGMAISKSSSIIAKLVLARLLVPEHFGFVSMVIVFTQIVKTGADLGFKNTLVHRRRDASTALLYDSAFWLLLFAGLVILGLFWAVGVPLLVWFYDEPELAPIATAMSVAILLHNLPVVPEARLARAMRFKQIAICEISGTLVGCAIAILLAVQGAGVWALVAQSLIHAACTMVALFVVSGWRPHFRLSLPLLAEVRSYSSFIVGSRSLTYLQQNLDYLLIGKLIGAYALGIYAIAFLVTETLRAQVFWLVGRVVFPVYSRVLGRPHQIRTVYLGTVRYMTIIIFPLATTFLLFADPAVNALFTSKWAEAIVPIQILAVASMVVASAGTPGDVLRGVGRPDTDFRINLAVTLLVAFPALWVGILWLGLPGAALAVLAHYSVSRMLFHLAIRRQIELRELDVLRAMQPALVGCMLMVGCKFLLAGQHWLIAAGVATTAYALAVLPTVWPHLKWAAGKSSASSASPVLVILGPDGAGKTSLAENLERQLPGGGRRLYLGMSLDEKWALPGVRALEIFRRRQERSAVRAAAGVLMWYLLFPLELIARRLAYAWRSPGGAMVIDRLPGTPYLGNSALSHWYRCLIPRVDQTVLLTGDPEIIAQRKPDETSADRTARDMEKWELVALRTHAGACMRLDTTQHDLQSCTRQVLETLLHRGARPSGLSS